MLVSLVGVAAWSGYLWVRFGDPLAFLTVQGALGWDQGSGPATWFKVAYLLDWQQRLRNPVLLLTAQALAGLSRCCCCLGSGGVSDGDTPRTA